LVGVGAGGVEDIVLDVDVLVPIVVVGFQPQGVAPAGRRRCEAGVVPDVDPIGAAVGLKARTGRRMREVLVPDVGSGGVGGGRAVAGNGEGAPGVAAVNLVVSNNDAVELGGRIHAVIEAVERIVACVAVDQARIDAHERVAIVIAAAGNRAE